MAGYIWVGKKRVRQFPASTLTKEPKPRASAIWKADFKQKVARSMMNPDTQKALRELADKL